MVKSIKVFYCQPKPSSIILKGLRTIIDPSFRKRTTNLGLRSHRQPLHQAAALDLSARVTHVGLAYRNPDADPDGSGSRSDAAYVRAWLIFHGPQMKMLAVLIMRAEVIPAVRGSSVNRAVEFGCPGFFHDKGVVEMDIVVLEAVPECLQGVDVCWPTLDLGLGSANVLFPVYIGRCVDQMVFGAAIAHRTFKEVITSTSDCQKDVQEEDDKEDGIERRHLEEGESMCCDAECVGVIDGEKGRRGKIYIL